MRSITLSLLLFFDSLAAEEIATLAGGCFWCVEADLEKAAGVREVISGYSGGKKENPTYAEVSSGTTGHVEAVQVYFNPEMISYGQLLNFFWKGINPTDDGGQFSDRGAQYRTAIFYHSEEQKKIAEESKTKQQANFDAPIVTEILPFKDFYLAEEYHQDYAKKNPWRYKIYRNLSGRNDFIKEQLMKKLTPLQYNVTQEDGTEPAFNNDFWDHKEPGIYVDVVSGEPLFSSTDKYDSKTGWPSFTKPLVKENLIEKEDNSLFSGTRTEVRSKGADSHLGHLFPDGPPPTNDRYCINSAALRFIPVKDLEKEGYGEFQSLFD